MYVWPHSGILGDKTTQAKVSTLHFLRKHKFDFNKLFSDGVNYQRLVNEDLIKKKIEGK